MTGRCKWYSLEKGYGFIEGDDGKDYFVHCTKILPVNTVARDQILMGGESVKFDIKQVREGLQAVNVEVMPCEN